MKLNDYLTELKIGKDPELETIFNYALAQVFKESYLNKIENKIKGRIKIKEKINKNQNVVAWNQGTIIYVNKPVFFAKAKGLQIKYLLHEFTHVLHHSKSFLIKRNFKDLNQLSHRLWKIANQHTKNLGVFLTGKNVEKKFLNPEETLAYFMNNQIKWKYISPEGKVLFLKELNGANIFNLTSPFWKARLS